MSNSAVSRFSFAVLAAVLIWGCERSDRDAQKVPLGQAGSGSVESGEAATAMTGEAKAALDSANILFRARAYDRALEQYRLSARLAPTDLTPLLGILMVAEATGDSRLANSTLARVRELNPNADTAALMRHSEMIDVHSRPRDTTPPSK